MSKPENKLAHLKQARMKLEDLRLLSLTEKDYETLLNIKTDLSDQIKERDRLFDGLCALESFLDRKKKFKLVKFNNALYGRKFMGVNAAHIRKVGFNKVIEPLEGKAERFVSQIYKKIADQNRKNKQGICYGMELVFFKDGRSKNPDDIIISIVREENGEGCSLVWVGWIGGQYHIIY